MKPAMNRLLRTLLALVSLVIIAVMPTPAGAACVDDSGNPAKEGGIGGTGDPAKEGGIGGTGIIGAITGFASICVNGLEVHFDAATLVSINGTTADATMLAVGQIVALAAENSPKGLQARSVAVLHALEGPVTDISQEHGVALVMGRTVRTTANTKFDGLAELSDLRPGSMVRVSGYKNARAEVVATRIQLAQGLREASAIGMVASDRRDRFTLDGLPVANLAVAPESGGEAMVRGAWNGKELIAREIVLDPSLPFAGRVDRVVAEGLIAGADAERLKISGFEVDIRAAGKIAGGTPAELIEGRKVRITGTLADGRHIKAERIELVRHGNGSDSAGNSRQPRQKQAPMESGAPAAGAMERGARGNAIEKMPANERVNRVERMERIERPERMEPPARMEHMDRHQTDGGRPGGR